MMENEALVVVAERALEGVLIDLLRPDIRWLRVGGDRGSQWTQGCLTIAGSEVDTM